MNKNVDINNMSEAEMLDFGDDDIFSDLNSTVVEDTVQQHKDTNNEVQQKKKQPKQKKEKKTNENKKGNTIIIIILAIIIVAIAIIVSIVALLSNSNQHIKIVQQQTVSTVAVEEKVTEPEITNTEQSTNEQQAVIENTETVGTKNLNIVDSDRLNINEYKALSVVVNTKTANDTSYTDHDTEVYVGLTNVVTGYSNVNEYLQHYNDNSDAIINLPSESEFYEEAAGQELVAFVFEVEYPNNYPTNASDGFIYNQPELILSINGTNEEIENDDITDSPLNYIVLEDEFYKINDIQDISVKEYTDRFTVNDTLTYVFMTTLPYGANKDNYELKLSVNLNERDAETEVVFNGVEIEE
jgi:flagellar basal body-associated protein FliL